MTVVRLCLALVALLAAPRLAHAQDDELRAALAALPTASFIEKEAVVDRLIATRSPSVTPVLTALLEDRLYFRLQDNAVFIVTSADTSQTAFPLVDPISLDAAGSAPPDTLEKVGTNNRLRRFLRIALARFSLSSPDAGVRLAAVKEMMRSLDATAAEVLKERAGAETDPAVTLEIETALAMVALDDPDPAIRLKAVETLQPRARPEVRNRLAALIDVPEGGGEPPESDEGVRRAAALAVRAIDGRLGVFAMIETLFFGLSLGSVLVLIAIGLGITFGIMGVINMAHGELMMLGAYTTYVVQLLLPGALDWSILVAIPAAFVVSGLAGILLERSVIRWLYGRPLETLLATFGVSLILQQLVRSIFSANNRAVSSPPWLSGTVQVTESLALTWNRIYIVLFTIAVFGLLLLVLKRTRIGLQIRAVSQNREMAQAMGIRTARVDALTFGLGAGLAGIAGVALSQLTNVGPNLGQAYIVDSFMVVVFGGVGNLWGALIGGLSLGMVNKMLEPYAGAVLGKIAVLIALVVFIQYRPRGLFPQTGRAAESGS